MAGWLLASTGSRAHQGNLLILRNVAYFSPFAAKSHSGPAGVDAVNNCRCKYCHCANGPSLYHYITSRFVLQFSMKEQEMAKPRRRRLVVEHLQTFQYWDQQLRFDFGNAYIREQINELNRRKNLLEELKQQKALKWPHSPELIQEVLGNLKEGIERMEAGKVLNQEDARTLQSAYQQAYRLLGQPAESQRPLVQQLVNINRAKAQMNRQCQEMLEKIELAKKKKSELKQSNSLLLIKQQEQKGLIRVYCRIAPAKDKDKARCCQKVKDKQQLKIFKQRDNVSDPKKKNKETILFHFDHIFEQTASQVEVFKQFSPVIEASVYGKRLCIFSYGQSGSGKSHTIIGSPNDEGIAIRTIRLIFKLITKQEETGWRYRIRIGGEQLSLLGRKDLLANSKIKGNQKATLLVDCQEKAICFVKYCAAVRTTKATKNNPSSSRSHFLISIEMEAIKGSVQRHGSICISDLAGSQKSGTAENKKQTSFINIQLHNLSSLIISIANNSIYKPPQNSLPAVLKPYLGRDTLTMTIISLCPDKEHQNETNSSAMFAAKLREVRKG